MRKRMKSVTAASETVIVLPLFWAVRLKNQIYAAIGVGFNRKNNILIRVPWEWITNTSYDRDIAWLNFPNHGSWLKFGWKFAHSVCPKTPYLWLIISAKRARTYTLRRSIASITWKRNRRSNSYRPITSLKCVPTSKSSEMTLFRCILRNGY